MLPSMSTDKSNVIWIPNAARWNVFKVTVFFYRRVIVSLTVHVSRTSVQLCLFFFFCWQKKKQCRVKRHCLKSIQVCRTCCQNFSMSPKTHLSQILQKKFLFLTRIVLFFFIYVWAKTSQDDTCCGTVMHSRVWKHSAAVYTVHKSTQAQSPMQHPAVESFRTVQRPIPFLFIHTKERTLWFMLTQAWSEMMYSRRS